MMSTAWHFLQLMVLGAIFYEMILGIDIEIRPSIVVGLENSNTRALIHYLFDWLGFFLELMNGRCRYYTVWFRVQSCLGTSTCAHVTWL